MPSSDRPTPDSAHNSHPSPQPRRTSLQHAAKPENPERQAGTLSDSDRSTSDTQSGLRSRCKPEAQPNRNQESPYSSASTPESEEYRRPASTASSPKSPPQSPCSAAQR